MKIEVLYNVITTDKLTESTDFYTRLFGFEVVADLGWYKQLRYSDGIELAFMEPGHPSQPDIFKHQWSGRGMILSIQVDEIDEIYEKVKTSEVEIVFELKEEEWGQKHFAIQDPNGIPVDVVMHM